MEIKALDNNFESTFYQFVEKIGMRLTNGQRLVVKSFVKNKQHASACEIAAAAGVGESVARTTLKLMVKYGFATRLNPSGGETLYEPLQSSETHDHLVCSKCGRIIEFHNRKIEVIKETIAAEYGFHAIDYMLEIYGLCGECFNNRGAVVPLVWAGNMERVEFRRVDEAEYILAMNTLGLHPGDELTVLSNSIGAPVVVSKDDARIVIERDMAQKIMVAVCAKYGLTI